MSQALAQLEERELIEAKLWTKISQLCHDIKLPMDEAAPDFVCAPQPVSPPVGVFRLAHDPDEASEPEGLNAFKEAEEENEE